VHSPSKLKSAIVVPVFGFTIFSSAFLLFQVQLIIAKYILPWFGGTPAVFTACLLFFQTLLLFGYCYAYLIDAKLSSLHQALLHSTLILFALAWLRYRFHVWHSPLLPDASWNQFGVDHPLVRVIALLSVSVGIPYFVLSSTGPLLQSWYGRIREDIPYRLYALSNAGSLLALLTYPFIVEPSLPLRAQAKLWGLGFALFSGGCLITAAISRKDVVDASLKSMDTDRAVASIPWRRKLTWLLLAGTASLSLLATTNQICQEVAAVPLLWVLPLSLYLLSFIICFSSDGAYSRNFWSVGLGLATALVCFAIYQPELGIVYLIAIYSFALFAVCMVCHGELAGLKPPKQYLTNFYLFVATGGMLGGIFVTIVAPLLFRGFWEFPLSLWMAIVLFGLLLLRDTASWIYVPRPLLLSFAMVVVFAGPGLARIGLRPIPVAVSSLGVAALAAFFLSGNSAVASSAGSRKRAAWLSFSLSLVLIIAVMASPFVAAAVGATEVSRNFYGVLTVSSESLGGSPIRKLQHGRVLHGLQFLDESKRRQPTSYYSVDSGIGSVLTEYPGRAAGKNLRIGVVGLGVGTIAAYGKPGDYIRFYEINPEVIRLASGQNDTFSFLGDSRAQIEAVPGDARLSLEQELTRGQNGDFDVLAIDAFSGDAIPIHLLTQEAFTLYLRHLKDPTGVLAFHVSNNALDLTPVVARLAAERGMSAWLARSYLNGPGSAQSKWIIVAHQASGMNVPGAEHMTGLAPDSHFPLWTDDYSDLMRVIAW